MSEFNQTILDTVAHDLKAPLQCIQGYAQVLSEGRLSPEEAARVIGIIQRCCRWACSMVSDLAESSAADLDKLVLNREPVDLVRLVEEAAAAYQVLCDAKKVRLTLCLPLVPCRVLADSERIRRVIDNLVSNALKYTPSGGTISLSAGAAGAECFVEVRDNGSGFDPALREKLFEKFFQARRENHGSLGLGLFIARKIVEAHGGGIRAGSEGPGTGACLRFSLPAYDPEAAYARFRSERAERLTPRPGRPQ
jgi:signal transduction histidine kinase